MQHLSCHLRTACRGPTTTYNAVPEAAAFVSFTIEANLVSLSTIFPCFRGDDLSVRCVIVFLTTLFFSMRVC